MLKKTYVIILMICFTLIFVSCGINKNNVPNNEASVVIKATGQNNKNPAPADKLTKYEITKAIYADKDIKINYPQIANLNDSNKQKIINEIIKDEVLKILSSYDGETDNLTLDVNYNIKWKGSNLLSIQYIGSGYLKDGAYPNNIFYTTNIDINNGIKIKIKDLVNINENFIKKLKKGKYELFDAQLNVESETKNEVNKYAVTDLIEYLKKADDMSAENELSAYSYFTDDSIGISISVPHAIGDHAEFEIKYKDILSNVKTENGVWKDFSSVVKTKK